MLTDYVGANYACGGDSWKIAKALASTAWWLNDEYCVDPCAVGYDPSTNNASGFGAVPAGGYWYGGFNYAGYGADFWSSTEGDSSYAYSRYLYYSGAYVNSGSEYDETYGFSVRCLRD